MTASADNPIFTPHFRFRAQTRNGEVVGPFLLEQAIIMPPDNSVVWERIPVVYDEVQENGPEDNSGS